VRRERERAKKNGVGEKDICYEGGTPPSKYDVIKTMKGTEDVKTVKGETQKRRKRSRSPASG